MNEPKLQKIFKDEKGKVICSWPSYTYSLREEMRFKLCEHIHEGKPHGYFTLISGAIDDIKSVLQTYAENYDWCDHDGYFGDGHIIKVYVFEDNNNFLGKYEITLKTNPEYIIKKVNYEIL